MPSQAQQLRQRFIVTGAVLALALAGLLYLLARARVGAQLEDQEEAHARAISTRAASVVTVSRLGGGVCQAVRHVGKCTGSARA